MAPMHTLWVHHREVCHVEAQLAHQSSHTRGCNATSTRKGWGSVGKPWKDIQSWRLVKRSNSTSTTVCATVIKLVVAVLFFVLPSIVCV